MLSNISFSITVFFSDTTLRRAKVKQGFLYPFDLEMKKSRVEKNNNMNAVLDLKGGDYKVWLTPADLEELYSQKVITGELLFRRNGTEEKHTISISFKKRKAVQDVKAKLKSEEKIFYEGPAVMIEHQHEKNHHRVYYDVDKINNLQKKFFDPMQYQENRYDGVTGRKIFLYPA
jgi:hypothetical protein